MTKFIPVKEYGSLRQWQGAPVFDVDPVGINYAIFLHFGDSPGDLMVDTLARPEGISHLLIARVDGRDRVAGFLYGDIKSLGLPRFSAR